MTSIKPNRLAGETSPYLLQHAQNPVDWYPWGDEAFSKARAEDKPVFVSIGYSTCHWCHVMAHESFESGDVAEVLGAGFVSVKVDREERPDIDEVYMNVCQAMTGSGGWPLTVIMTPDKKPFFAGTYLPKTAAHGRMGLIELLGRVSDIWESDRDALTAQGEKVAAALSTHKQAKTDGTPDGSAVIAAAHRYIASAYDSTNGGFSQAPKFPMPHYLLFLLCDWKENGNQASLDMTEHTLEAMYRGGIFDHVGGGFSRYATDSQWLVPHFEKMLYDNAMLLLAYTECFAATGKSFYRDVAGQIAAYVLRDMQAPSGGFYSAEDADSEGMEGKFYVWRYDELAQLLDANELRILETHYGVTREGNFEGSNILNMNDAPSLDVLKADAVLRKLYEVRLRRVPPFKDTKISASWNGMMIGALARAGVVFDNPLYTDIAKKAADLVLGAMLDERGMLCGIYKDEQCGDKGFLADYANITNALITLYTATLDIAHLKSANELLRAMIARFYDADEQRFYMAAKEDEQLFMRPRDDYDGAALSGSAGAVMALVRLWQLTGAHDLETTIDNVVSTLGADAAASPGAHVHFISALMMHTQPTRQVVISAGRQDKDAKQAYKDIASRFLPSTSVIFYDGSADMTEMFPELGQYASDKPFAAYVCENFSCKQPVYSRAALMQTLGLA